jgi:hypothetical protein
MIVRVLVPAALATLVAFAAVADAGNGHKPGRQTASLANPVQSGPVAYEPDGTPIATGAPRRLSVLAGNDRKAWSSLRGGRASTKHKPVHRWK